MPFLFVGSTGDKAGHSIITWAVASALLDRGLRVGFLKPFGTSPVQHGGVWSDADALLFKKVLALEAPMERICPYPLPPDVQAVFASDTLHSEIAALADSLALETDILLVMGSTHMFLDDASHPAPDISLVNRLEADLLVVHRYRKLSTTRYSLFSIGSLLKDRLKGIIINRIPAADFDKDRAELARSFARSAVPITALLQEDPRLACQTLSGAARGLEAEVLSGKGSLDTMVCGMTVGSAALPASLALFRRVYHKLILLKPNAGGEPAGSVAGIVITGGGKPLPAVLEAARKAGVPLMAAQHDTFTCIERLEQQAGTLSYHDEYKVRHIVETMEKGGGVERLLSSLNL